ncbi:dihydroxy-acid dehydratase [Oceanobacillus picturae]|uniref:Dihydroxy-acid dehydratase n=1 Tax=Oceanobacillus picturae TaxID=171693 RepID=A0A0U9H7S7_9BACI|nr:DUF4166 domain-containing protein [Oceanobacillus picturae]GAQ18711.1 dihydroxy-acid dehydratase [Oceanobacillus picturae]
MTVSIYEQILGQAFYQLHPKLQQRYTFLQDCPFEARGVMKRIKGVPKGLLPLGLFGVKRKLLFPERGKEVPFTLKNTPGTGRDGEAQVHWERIFYFGEKQRYFNALMRFNAKEAIIEDYLGEPPIVYSDLELAVDHGALTITSKRQRLLLGPVEIPLPSIFQGKATVKEAYIEEKEAYTISVQVKNPLIGTIFAYEGAFRHYDI